MRLIDADALKSNIYGIPTIAQIKNASNGTWHAAVDWGMVKAIIDRAPTIKGDIDERPTTGIYDEAVKSLIKDLDGKPPWYSAKRRLDVPEDKTLDVMISVCRSGMVEEDSDETD